MTTDHRPPTADQQRLEDQAARSQAESPARGAPRSSIFRPPSSILHPRWPEFHAGFVATLPLWLGVAPFGAIYAVTALAAGLTPAQTLVMSLLVFAGAAQFTAAGLFGSGAAPFTILITSLIVNARLMLLAASLAPHVRHAPAWLRALLAFHLTDESYAIGMRAFLADRGSLAYQLGANLSVYISWVGSTAAGIMLGALIPDPAAYGLDLVFPFTFIGLLVPLLRGRTNMIVALLAGALTIGGALLLPGRWYILIAGIAASGAGAIVSRTEIGD
ncbi:MAG: AzlC family ABC transporter permease [Roseiflexaceae bacterium]